MPIQKNEYQPSAVADTFTVNDTGTCDPVGAAALAGMYLFHSTSDANLDTAAGSVANATIYLDVRPSASAAPTTAELLAGIATWVLAPGDTIYLPVNGCKVYAAGLVADLILTYQPLEQNVTVYDD